MSEHATAVLDASTLFDALRPGKDTDCVRDALTGYDELAGPEHLRVEVYSVMRRLYKDHDPAPPGLATMRGTLAELDLTEVPFNQIHHRIWQLRHMLTCYDAAYAAAAEHLGAILLSSDRALHTHPGLHCRVLDPRNDQD